MHPRNRSTQPRNLYLPLDTKLADAIEETELAATEASGVICPCCEQILCVYHRTLTPGQCEIVLRLAAAGRGYHDVQEILRGELFTRIGGSGDFAKAKYWQLIERHPTKALWRLTDRGFDFADGLLAVDSTLLILRDKVIGVASESEPRTIQEIVGSTYRIDAIYTHGSATMSDLQDAIAAAGEW